MAAQGTIPLRGCFVRPRPVHSQRHPIVQAVSEKSGKKEFSFNNAQVTPKESLWTACIDVTI